MTTVADSILGHCMKRATLARLTPDKRYVGAFAVLRTTPKAARCAALIAMWATALVELERDTIGVEEYAEWAFESRRTVYRRLIEFREIWPEYHTPNELAVAVAQVMRERDLRVASPSLPVAI